MEIRDLRRKQKIGPAHQNNVKWATSSGPAGTDQVNTPRATVMGPRLGPGSDSIPAQPDSQPTNQSDAPALHHGQTTQHTPPLPHEPSQGTTVAAVPQDAAMASPDDHLEAVQETPSIWEDPPDAMAH